MYNTLVHFLGKSSVVFFLYCASLAKVQNCIVGQTIKPKISVMVASHSTIFPSPCPNQ